MFKVERHAFLAAILLSATASAWAAPPAKVKLHDGKLTGTYDDAAKVYSFKGIPYAAPPVGNLRWEPPQPVVKWKGTMAASEFAPRCMQGKIYDDMVFRDKGPVKTVST